MNFTPHPLDALAGATGLRHRIVGTAKRQVVDAASAVGAAAGLAPVLAAGLAFRLAFRLASGIACCLAVFASGAHARELPAGGVRPAARAVAASTPTAAASVPARLSVPESRPAAAPSVPTAEQQLEAIREALIRAVEESPTRVVSTAWVDAAGALHETAFFNATARVRGVRVTSYLDDRSGRSRLHATADVELPGHVKAAARAVRSGAGTDKCDAPASPWRMPVSFEIVADASARGDARVVAALLARRAQYWWHGEANRSVGWHPLGSALTVGTEVGSVPVLFAGRRSPSGYGRILLGEEARTTAWVARLQIVAPRGAAQGWRLGFSISHAGEATPALEDWVSVPDGAVPESVLGERALAALGAALARWQERVDARMTCEPPVFEARHEPDSGWSLAVGPEAGFRIGQRVLILDRQRVPARGPDAEALAALAMAEVREVAGPRITLRQMAGPPLQPGGDWVALPM